MSSTIISNINGIISNCFKLPSVMMLSIIGFIRKLSNPFKKRYDNADVIELLYGEKNDIEKKITQETHDYYYYDNNMCDALECLKEFNDNYDDTYHYENWKYYFIREMKSIVYSRRFKKAILDYLKSDISVENCNFIITRNFCVPQLGYKNKYTKFNGYIQTKDKKSNTDEYSFIVKNIDERILKISVYDVINIKGSGLKNDTEVIFIENNNFIGFNPSLNYFNIDNPAIAYDEDNVVVQTTVENIEIGRAHV